MTGNVIETERLRLRLHKLSDFENVAALWGAPEVVRFISGKPSSREDSWGRLLRYVGHWQLLGHGFWAIEDKATGQFLGEGGFGSFKREIEPPIEAPEQGWAFNAAAQGKGYAYEAMKAAADWGEAHFKRTDFTCIISPDNAPSLKLAHKLGYREVARVSYKDTPTVMLQRA